MAVQFKNVENVYSCAISLDKKPLVSAVIVYFMLLRHSAKQCGRHMCNDHFARMQRQVFSGLAEVELQATSVKQIKLPLAFAKFEEMF